MRKEIKQILNDLNLKISCKGYDYWVTAIEYVLHTITELESRPSMVRGVYGHVAETYNTTRSRSERAMRHILEDKENLIKEYFGIDYKIANSDFLYLCVNRIEELDNSDKAKI